MLPPPAKPLVPRRALILIRDQPHYRRDAFVSGAKAAGFSVVASMPSPARGDLLVIWNRYGHWHSTASAVEAAGGMVLVAENGYVGKDDEGRRLYAIQRSMLHGFGEWPRGGPERWEERGVAAEPWRPAGSEVIVLAQRGIGISPVSASPHDAERIATVIRTTAKLPVRIRSHPGDKEHAVPLREELRNALCVVTHTSAAGLHAMLMGVPCVTTAERWIGLPGAAYIPASPAAAWAKLPELLRRDDAARLQTFQRLAWAQWTINEIQSGLPFRCMFT